MAPLCPTCAANGTTGPDSLVICARKVFLGEEVFPPPDDGSVRQCMPLSVSCRAKTSLACVVSTGVLRYGCPLAPFPSPQPILRYPGMWQEHASEFKAYEIDALERQLRLTLGPVVNHCRVKSNIGVALQISDQGYLVVMSLDGRKVPYYLMVLGSANMISRGEEATGISAISQSVTKPRQIRITRKVHTQCTAQIRSTLLKPGDDPSSGP